MIVGSAISFKPLKGKVRTGVLVSWPAHHRAKNCEVRLDGDPIAVLVSKSQVSVLDSDNGKPVRSIRKLPSPPQGDPSQMSASAAKELRIKAQSLGIEGWSRMGRQELADAVASATKSKPKKATGPKTKATATKKVAKKSTAKKVVAKKTAPAKKAATKKAAPKKAVAAKRAPVKKAAPKKAAPKAKRQNEAVTQSGKADKLDKARNGLTKIIDPPKGVQKARSLDNPFREGSGLFHVFPLLIAGGKRKQMAAKLAKKVKLHPYKGGATSLDDYDKRIMLGAQTLRDKFGFSMLQSGRGPENGVLRVFIAGSKDDPRRG